MLLKLCKTNAVYEALPEKRAALDVGSFAQKFRSAGYAIMAELPQMMIAKKGCELTIYRSGRILIKTDSRDEAEKASEEAYRILGIK